MNVAKLTDKDIVIIKSALEFCIRTTEALIKDKDTPKPLREAAKEVLKHNKITYVKIDKIYNELLKEKTPSKDALIKDIKL